MALTEITKGMSNAAEVINANFKEVGVVESGSNANGRFIKYGDGTVIAYSDALTSTYDSSLRLSVSWKLPTTFVGEYTATVTGSKDAAQLADKLNSAVLNVGSNASDGIVLARIYATGSNTFISSDSVRVRLMAIGRWK